MPDACGWLGFGWWHVASTKSLTDGARIWIIVVIPVLVSLFQMIGESYSLFLEAEHRPSAFAQPWLAIVPPVLTVLKAGVLSVLLGVNILAWRKLCRKGVCLKCGYDLTGNVSGVCPECGTAVD